MVRNITQEEQEAIKLAAWKEGFARCMEIYQAERDAREADCVQRGIRMGRNEVLKEFEGVQWNKLRRIVLSLSIAGSIIGCGIILAIAVGLTNLPQ